MSTVLTNIIAIVVTAAIITAIVVYLVKEKKKGAACIGCPYYKECAKHKCNCQESQQNDEQN